MAIHYPDVLRLRKTGVRTSWTDREPMLYALGVGMGSDPLNRQELPFVYEKSLKVLSTFATVIARAADPGPIDLNRAKVLDGERDLVIHRPLPAAAEVTMDGRIVAVYDKGEEKGAVLVREVVLKDAATEQPLVTLTSSTFARGDGGFGGPSEGQREPHPVPVRAPDRIVEITTRPDQALIYRLSGDRNPLHCDPEFANRAGFEKPILHGLCSYGICYRAVLQTYADFDPGAISRHRARFSSSVYPGETLQVALWKEGDIVSFEARIADRKVTVIKNGCSVLR
jgi:acyl dehydratase